MNGSPPSSRSGLAIYLRLLGYTRRYWPIALVAIVGMILDAGGLGLFAHVIKPMLDKLFIQRDPLWIYWMPAIIVSIFLVRSIGMYVADYGTAYIGRGVVQQMREQVFDHYLRLPSAFFDRESSATRSRASPTARSRSRRPPPMRSRWLSSTASRWCSTSSTCC